MWWIKTGNIDFCDFYINEKCEVLPSCSIARAWRSTGGRMREGRFD